MNKRDMPKTNTEVETLKAQLQELSRKCAFLQKVVNEVPANIYISDLEKGVVWCNRTNEETLGYTLEEILSMGGLQYFREIVHPDDQNIPADSIAHYKSFSGAEYGGIFRAKHKEEETYKWFVGWAKAFTKNNDGDVKELLCVDVDMSPRMNTEEQLITALRENLKQKNNLLVQSLRKREIEILTLVAQGLSTKEIAQQLFLSEHTVHTHRRNIQRKLGTTNLAELVLLAREAGLVSFK
jgi:DNA-binding CsgD family transcriptional regulator